MQRSLSVRVIGLCILHITMR